MHNISTYTVIITCADGLSEVPDLKAFMGVAGSEEWDKS